MSADLSRADLFMRRLLLVPAWQAPAIADAGASQGRRAENALTLSLLFSGTRCILQYALLPFLLPIIGIAAEAAAPILLLINAVAILSIFFSLRRFWSIAYRHRWTYLVVALAALTLLIAFTAYDISQLGSA